MKKLATVSLAGLMIAGTFSVAMAADAVKPAPAPAPVVHPLLHHPILWCAGGVIISVVVHSPVPAIVGCAVGAVELVHYHY